MAELQYNDFPDEEPVEKYRFIANQIYEKRLSLRNLMTGVLTLGSIDPSLVHPNILRDQELLESEIRSLSMMMPCVWLVVEFGWKTHEYFRHLYPDMTSYAVKRNVAWAELKYSGAYSLLVRKQKPMHIRAILETPDLSVAWTDYEIRMERFVIHHRIFEFGCLAGHLKSINGEPDELFICPLR